MVLQYAFSEMELHHMGLRVVAYNKRAIHHYAACGFVEESREREAAFVAGSRYEDIAMDTLASEFHTSQRE